MTTSKSDLDSTRDTTGEIDLDEVATLIDALERDLQKIQGNSAEVQRLRDEVQTLKNLLQSPVRRHHWVRDALHGIREGVDGALDSAVAGGVQASRYIAEIGRILGM
jgi:cell division septum initiation protein DivIVA